MPQKGKKGMTKMKKMKKMMALVLAVAMCLAMSMTTTVMSFADDDPAPTTGHTISLKSTDTHTYQVFQVLTGTLAEAGSKELGNPAWGADATAEAKATDVNDFIEDVTNANLSEQDVAQLVATKVDTTKGQGTIDKDHPMSGLATGYYVLVDVTTLQEYGDPKKIDTKALNVVRVVNDINDLDIKWGTTEDKKVIVSDTLGNSANGNPVNGDTDNVSIGDTVNFKITAKVPANADKYNYFYFVINDTLDPGLTLDGNSIVVYHGSVGNDNILTKDTHYSLSITKDQTTKKTTFKVGLINAKEYKNEDIIVTYSAVLNENAEIGEIPNTNKSTVDYSNDPNHDYDGEHYPGFPDQKEKNYMGETPVTETKTYTTSIQIQKVDDKGQVLTGAEFTITGNSTEIVLVSSEEFTADAAGTYYKLNNGSYTTESPVTADYMEEAPGADKGYVVDNSYNGDDKVVIGDTTYRPYAPATDTGETVYVLVKANADQYESPTTKYKKTVTYTQKKTTGTDKVDAKAMVGADGVVEFRGLGAGEYTITETKTPAGYNTIDPITVNIAFTAKPTGTDPHWSKTSGNATYNSTTGVFEVTIENNKGTELPSTGGMGTTIFYIAGAILVIGAVVLLIARKKAER